MTDTHTSTASTRAPIYQHIIFWVLYYILFGVIWMRDGDYQASFFMEFVLLPIRIACVYFSVIYLIPRYLLQRRFGRFVVAYLLMLLVAAIFQNVLLYYFVQSDSIADFEHIFYPDRLLRAAVLVNTTVILISALYILKLYFDENNIDAPEEMHWHNPSRKIEVKANRRHHLIDHDDIVYVEGLGNYVSYNIADGRKLTVHSSLKKCLEDLDNDGFLRVHKSFIINRAHIASWDKETIEMYDGSEVPISGTFDIELLGA